MRNVGNLAGGVRLRLRGVAAPARLIRHLFVRPALIEQPRILPCCTTPARWRQRAQVERQAVGQVVLPRCEPATEKAAVGRILVLTVIVQAGVPGAAGCSR